MPVTYEGTVLATAPGLTPDERVLTSARSSGVDLRLAVPNDFEAGSGGFAGTNQWQWGVPSFDQGPATTTPATTS